MVKIADITILKKIYQWKLKLLSVFFLVLICSQITSIANAYSQNETEIHSHLEADTFFSYTVTTGFIRGWNYTINGSSLTTHNGSAFYAPEVSSTILVRIEFITDTTISIRYEATTEVGYDIDYLVVADYDSDNGQISITNGSLSGFSGFTGLFLEENWISGVSTISELGSWNVTSEFAEDSVLIEIRDEYQIFTRFSCKSYDSVDGEMTHQRRYDSDTGILLQCSGAISDPFIFGLGNISYFLGSVILTDTNFDLGPPQTVSIIPIELILGIAAVGVFGVFYIVFYKAQRRPSKTVSKKSNLGKRKIK